MNDLPDAEKDVTRCEYEGCDAMAWRVLFWGPGKTAPCRAACWQHEGETDLALFVDRNAGEDAGVLAPRCPHCGWQAIDRRAYADLMGRAAARLREVLPSFTDPRHYANHADIALVRDLEARVFPPGGPDA